MELFAVLTEETVDGKVRGCPFPFISETKEEIKKPDFFATKVIDVRSIDEAVVNFEEFQDLLLVLKLLMKGNRRFQEIFGVVGEVFFWMGADFQKQLDSQTVLSFPPPDQDKE